MQFGNEKWLSDISVVKFHTLAKEPGGGQKRSIINMKQKKLDFRVKIAHAMEGGNYQAQLFSCKSSN